MRFKTIEAIGETKIPPLQSGMWNSHNAVVLWRGDASTTLMQRYRITLQALWTAGGNYEGFLLSVSIFGISKCVPPPYLCTYYSTVSTQLHNTPENKLCHHTGCARYIT